MLRVEFAVQPPFGACAFGDARTGIVVERRAVGIGDPFGSIVTDESTYAWGFSNRFARDVRVQVRSMTFNHGAFLTEVYLEQLVLAGPYSVTAGTYVVLNDKPTVSVRRRRDRAARM